MKTWHHSPGESFRVLRVLKGAVRSNFRIDPAGGGSPSCGTTVPQVDYVLVTLPDGSPAPLDLRTEFLRGQSAVREAESVLGDGTSPPRRPDAAWLAQWFLILAFSILVPLAWWKLARAVDKPPPSRA